MEEENKKDSNEVNEPSVQYTAAASNSRRIQFFNSHEEMELANAKELALFTPEQHLQHATSLIQRIYADELKNRFSDFNIHIK